MLSILAIIGFWLFCGVISVLYFGFVDRKISKTIDIGIIFLGIIALIEVLNNIRENYNGIHIKNPFYKEK